MPRCLVTGGAGFIGSHLVHGLAERGWSVRVLDDLSSGNVANLVPFEKQVQLVQGSVADARAVQDAVQDCELVFHLAALASVTKSVEEPLRSHEVCATGTLTVLDTDVATLDRRARAEFRGRNIGFIFQDFNLIPVLSARENVEYPLLMVQNWPADKRHARVAELLDAVGIGEHADKRPDQLSGG